MAKSKNHILACPYCASPLDVGDEKNAVVAHCYARNKSCDVKTWGSAATRFAFGDEKNPSHIIQTQPPELVERKQAAA